ncbi:hypothetical protein DL93DRAFT_2153759 [Clavulina sp. PMI_390]|nr:hypothetical protein DL93DRAFT_2153759 [Clavulina sp. PMI_390]
MGRIIVPITLDWVMGALVAIILYWIGFYEAPRTKVSPAFFQRDYSDNIVPDFDKGLFVVLLYLVVVGGGVYLTWRPLLRLITKLPTDNAADRACRIIMYIWLGIAALGLLLTVLDWIADGYWPSSEIVLAIVIMWHFVSLCLVIFLALIKGYWGHCKGYYIAITLRGIKTLTDTMILSGTSDSDPYEWTLHVSSFVNYLGTGNLNRSWSDGVVYLAKQRGDQIQCPIYVLQAPRLLSPSQQPICRTSNSENPLFAVGQYIAHGAAPGPESGSKAKAKLDSTLCTNLTAARYHIAIVSIHLPLSAVICRKTRSLAPGVRLRTSGTRMGLALESLKTN